jgi:gas vesicle protein
VAGLREKVMRSQSKERSKFEVSLSHIPPELQVQLEARLRKELGPRVLDEARTQSAQVLESAKLAIEQVTSHSHTEFRQRVSQDLQAVEKRVQAVSADTVLDLRDHQRREMGEFHQHVVDAGNHLNRVSEELLQAQQHTLAETSDGHRRKLDQLQATVAAEASRLRAEVADLNNRIAMLGESARALESGLDIRLSNLASNTVRDARTQLESSVETMLDNLDTRGAGKVAEQVTNASERLAILQTEIEETISESARVLAERMLEAFEKSLDEEARKSVERCRGALAHGVNSLLRTLGEQFQMDVAISEHRERDWTK